MTPGKCRKSNSLLVKGVELIVDQSQLLGVRHLMLLLGVRLPRLFDALTARHGDLMDLRSEYEVKAIVCSSRSGRKNSGPAAVGWRRGFVAIEPGPYVRALIPADAVY